MSDLAIESSKWAVHVFGKLRVTGRGVGFDQFYTKRAAYLLARLAVSRRLALSRSEVADFLWPDDFFDATQLRLRQELARLRRGLGEARDILQSDRDWVRLAGDDVDVDVRTFTTLFQLSRKESEPDVKERRCREALALAGEEFMADYNEPWIDAERSRLAEIRYRLLIDLATLQAKRGDHASALESAKLAIDSDPQKEEGHVMVSEELGKLGFLTDALNQYQNLKKQLRNEVAESSSVSDSPSLPGDDTEKEPSARDNFTQRTRKSSTADDGIQLEPRSVGGSLTFAVAAPTEPIYGRAEELEHLMRLLSPEDAAHRLVTLTGPGGIGKTRLATEAAMQLQESYRGCVGWVSLADIGDPSNIPIAVASTLGIDLGAANKDPLERVTALISRQPSVLVFDNFEQLMPDGAKYVKTLISACPSLKVLLTSRIALKLTGERLIVIGPLPIPKAGDSLDQPSMRIFLDPLLAEQVVGDPTMSELELYREIVEKLEGIPLALQLASGRLRTVSAQDLIGQLDRRLDLVNQRSDAPMRHRTIRSAIEGSFQALTPELQQVMGRLSVFRGGWNQVAAASVCELEDPLPSMELLLDSSLIRVDREGKGLRFRMLETIRDYVRAEIPSADLTLAYRKHADWVIELGHPEDYRQLDTKALSYFNTIDPEIDNVREAARYCLDNDLPRAVRIGVAYGRYWSSRSLIRESLEFYKALFERVDLNDVTQDLARASFWHAQILYIAQAFTPGDIGFGISQRTEVMCEKTGLETERFLSYLHQSRTYYVGGENDRSLEIIRRSINRFRELGGPGELALAIQTASMIYYFQGKSQDAIAGMEEATSLLEGIDAPFHQVQTSMMLAFMYLETGDVAKSKVQAYQALGQADSFGFRQFTPMIQEVCGKVALAEGNLDLAADWFRTSANNWDFFGNVYQYADQLHLLARVHIKQGEPAAALPLLASAAEMLNNKGMTSVSPCTLVAAARAHLDLGQGLLAARLLGAYKHIETPTRDSELATEIAYVDAITRELEATLGAEGVAQAFADPPSLDEAYREAFSTRQ